MNSTQQRKFVADTLANMRSGRLSRREAARALAVLSLTAAAGATLGARRLGASSVKEATLTRHTLHAAVLQDHTATPAAGTGPELGERPDGTYVWQVRVAGMDMEQMIDAQAFFPAELTINAGDAVYFELPNPPGFHTVTFLSGDASPPLLIPDLDAGPVSPAAGPPQLMLNPAVMTPAGGDTYDGSGYFNSGVDVFRQPTDPPVVITFTEPGTYEYLCLPHSAVMKATIIVQEAGAERVEDHAAADARGEAELAALMDEGRQLIAEFAEATSQPAADGSTVWEVAAGAGAGQARLLRFLPETLEIAVGDTVRWINQSETEPHTVTFLGTGVEPPENTLVEPQADGTLKLIQNPDTLFPQGGEVYRGEGYVNSGLMGNIAPGGPSYGGSNPYELTFDTAGEYPYYCVLHSSGPEGPGMIGTIIVR